MISVRVDVRWELIYYFYHLNFMLKFQYQYNFYFLFMQFHMSHLVTHVLSSFSLQFSRFLLHIFHHLTPIFYCYCCHIQFNSPLCTSLKIPRFLFSYCRRRCFPCCLQTKHFQILWKKLKKLYTCAVLMLLPGLWRDLFIFLSVLCDVRFHLCPGTALTWEEKCTQFENFCREIHSCSI